MKKLIGGLSVVVVLLAFGTVFAGEEIPVLGSEERTDVGTELYQDKFPMHEETMVGSEVRGAAPGGAGRIKVMKEKKETTEAWESLLKPSGGYDIAN